MLHIEINRVAIYCAYESDAKIDDNAYFLGIKYGV